jgi:FMNH2-dependent dimethyl sulfone monooxygenase
MQFGVRLMQNPTDVDEILRRAQLADALGFDSVWLPDHVMWPRPIVPPHACVETWTAMTAVGAITQRVRLGYAMLNPFLRAPALLAKMVTTLDQLTKGRVIFSIGAGWYKAEYPAYGLSFLDDPQARAAHEEEVVRLCRRLWTEPSPLTFRGQHVQVEDCYFYPPPYQQPHPPIWFGGDSDRTRRLVRELGDGWLMHPQQAPQRPMTYATFTNCVVADSRAEAIARTADFTLTPAEQDREEMIRWTVLGKPEECLGRLREMESWGLNYLYLIFDGDESLERFAREIMPAFEQRAVPAGT